LLDPDPHSNCGSGSGFRRAKMTHRNRKIKSNQNSKITNYFLPYSKPPPPSTLPRAIMSAFACISVADPDDIFLGINFNNSWKIGPNFSPLSFVAVFGSGSGILHLNLKCYIIIL
jgi:hypothetical protein